MSYKYSWTVTSNYYYDATLTTDLIKDYLADWLDSSGKDTHFYSLSSMGNLFVWPDDREKQHDTSYHYEEESEEPWDPAPANSTYDYYMNFKMATGLNFAELRSSAAAAGLASHAYIPNGLGLADNTSAGNITFDSNGGLSLAGSNTLANDITFIDGGEVLFTDAGSGTQTLTGLLTSKDLEYIDMGFVERGGSSILSGGQVRRNLRELNVGVSTNNPVSGKTGSGLLVDGLVVRGVLNSVYVGSGASVNLLTVGLDRQWSGSDISAFLYESNGVLVPTYWGSRTNMTIASGGTATNITLGNGGTVYVSGLSDTVTSKWNEDKEEWEYTTAYASGTGGILKDLNMASSGGLQFEGITDPRATWNYPSNSYLNSRSYMSGFLATAPQSSYVSFGSNASGSNINIGNGGSLYIGKGARVSAISMGGLTTSTTFVNSSGTTDTWIGDRGANLQINGGYVSGVVMDPVLQTFDYYSAAHDYFWLHSESIKDAYSSAHGSYGSGEAWSSAMYASASATYRQYMSAMYNSGAVYTNLGDDTAYNRRYVGGTVGVAGGWIMNVSGFSYLGVAADVDVTVSNNVSTWKTYQDTDGNVSKAIGAVSATLDVTGGAHVYNVKIEGGRVIMTGGGEVNARWHSRENKQSNYNLVEDLDLRIGDVLGLGSAYPAVIEFFGEGSGGYKQYISSGGTSGYVDYTWDAIDPGEIHSVTASKGLVVSANWNKQDFTYIGSGAVTFNGLGTVVLKDNHSRYSSDSYYGTGPYLGSAFDEYYFGVVKGVYNEEDGVLENYTILDGTDGGFDWEGFLMVGSGGIVQNIGSASPLKTGNDIVNSDTWTPSYTRDECKVLTVVAGGSADKVTVKGAVSNFEHYESQYTESRAGLLVSSGGTATNVTVLEGGIAMAKGGTIDKVFVAAGGVLYLSGWAGAHQVGERDSDGHVDLSGPQYMDTTVLNGVRLDSGGQLTNTLDYGFRKGNAPSVIANKGGGIMNGVTANGVAYVSGLDFAGNITLTSGQQAIDVTVRGYKTITSRDEEGNPTAYNTTIAYMNVSSGGIVKGATVGDEGAIYVSNGADVSGLTASGGRIIFANSSGWSDYFAGSATVNGITVKDGGELEVNSKFGLTATNVKIEQDAGLTFTLGKTANEDYTPTTLNGTWTADWGNGTFQTNDGVLTGFGGQFGHEYRDLFYSSAYVSARLSMTIVEGGVLAGGDLRGYGSVLVKNGGKMLDTKLQGITANIGASGYASGLSATIVSGKNAYGTNIYVYGSGAVADATVLNGGYMGVERGGVINDVTMLCPEGYEGPAGNDTEVGPVELEVMAGGTANNVVASAGVVTLLDGSKEPGTAGPTLSNADIHSAAMLIVKGDGAVLGGTVNLAGLINTTAKRYEYVEVEVTDPNTGDTYTDWQRVEMNNSVADAATLTVNFDLTELNAPGTVAMIDNLANLTGVKLDRITVKADQTRGAYVLAGGAEDYNGALKVVRDGSFAGTITVGGYLQVTDDLTYSLLQNDNNELVFSVMSTEAAITNIVATSDGKELLKGKWSKYAINIKTEVNQYSKSIWYRIKQAVKPTTRGLRSVVQVEPEDDWIELDNEKGVDITEYCTIELKAKNEAGADSEIVEYTVNYDAIAPEIDGLRLVSGEPFLTPGVESAVVVSVTDDLDAAPALQLSLNDGVWSDVVRNDDGSYGFNLTGGIAGFTLRAIDHAENETVLSVSVPVDPVATADILTVTNQDVTVSAAFSADSMSKQYSLDGGETWLDYGDGVVLTENGTVSFRAANILGYSGVATLTVDYIDKIAPEKPIASADITAPTNQDVTVTATFSDDSVVKEYTLDGETWQAYDEGGVIIIINGTVGFRGVDAAGNISEVTDVVINNIDKTAPTISNIAPSTTEPAESVTVTATFSDDVAVASTLYRLGESGEWIAYPDGGVTVTENTTVYFKATDTAGNESEIASCTVTNTTPPVEPDLTGKLDSTFNLTDGMFASGVFVYTETGILNIFSGGLASNTSAAQAGQVNVFQSGKAMDVRVESDGHLNVSSGGVAGTVKIDSAGLLTLNEHGGVSGVTVHSGGGVNADANTFALVILADEGAKLSLTVAPNTSATGEYAGSAFEIGATASGYTIHSGGSLLIENGGVATDTTVGFGGSMCIGNGGSVSNTTVALSGALHISEGGFASGMTIQNLAQVHVSNGGFASDVNIDSQGSLLISQGGSVGRINLNSRGSVHVSNGGWLSSATVNPGGELTIDEGAAVGFTSICSGGSVFVSGGAVMQIFYADEGAKLGFTAAPNTDVVGQYGPSQESIEISAFASDFTAHSGWTLRIDDGGGAIGDTTVEDGGEIDVLSGGFAADFKIMSGGSLSVATGGKVFGKMSFDDGAIVSADAGAILDFNLTRTTPDADAFVNDLSFVMGQPFTYTLTVDETVTDGSYKLAENATDFDKTITVMNTSGTELGTISVAGGATPINGKKYTLTLDGGSLVLSIGDDLNGDLTSSFTLSSGMVGSSVNIKEGGELNVLSGGVVNDVTVNNNGSLKLSGGAAEDVTVASGGSLAVSSGATITGTMTIDAGASVSVVDGAFIIFDISQTAPGADALMNDLSSFAAVTTDYTVMVSGTQAFGDYKLAENAMDFEAVILVLNTNGDDLGNLYAWDAPTTLRDGRSYTMRLLEPGILCVTIGDPDLTPPVVSSVAADITEPTRQNVTVTAEFTDNVEVASALYKLGESGEWTAYPEGGVTVSENATVYFKAVDTSGNESEVASYEVTNIVEPDNKPDNGWNDYLYDKKKGWNSEENIDKFASNEITGNGEINLDVAGTIDTEDGYHNMFGNDGTNVDTGDVAHISVANPAKLTFKIESDAAGTFYVYEDGKDKKGKRAQITVGKVTVKAGQTAALKDICLTADGNYYVAMVAKNVRKAGTEGLYNVSVMNSTFFADADDGWNNAALNEGVVDSPLIVERGIVDLLLDNNVTDGGTFDNFVGLGDSIDYAKLELPSSANLSFKVTADGNAKFTLWKRNTRTGKLTKIGNPTTLKTKNGMQVTKTTAAKLLEVSDKYEYFVSMESTDAAKGESANYKVEINSGSSFFDSADEGENNWLYNKKSKTYNDDENLVENTISASGENQTIHLDDNVICLECYDNFVGHDDAADYAKIVLTEKGTLSFTITALADVTFEIWQKGKDKKGKDVLNSLQKKTSVKVKDNTVGSSETTAALALAAGEYYVSVTAKKTTANAKGSAFYNVTANFTSAVNDAQLAMPETVSAASDLAMPDSLSLGQYDTDALAGASVDAYLDSASDKLFGESGNGLLASL